jgi:hypothetical protein
MSRGRDAVNMASIRTLQRMPFCRRRAHVNHFLWGRRERNWWAVLDSAGIRRNVRIIIGILICRRWRCVREAWKSLCLHKTSSPELLVSLGE